MKGKIGLSLLVLLIFFIMTGCSNELKNNNNKNGNYENFYNDEITAGFDDIRKIEKDYSIESAINDNVVVVNNNTIKNSDLLDEFIESINKGKDAFFRFAVTTVEGNLIITDVKYKKDKVIVITDNTRDEFVNDTNRKITIEEYNYIEEIIDTSSSPAVSSLIVYSNNKENSMVLLKNNRIIN